MRRLTALVRASWAGAATPAWLGVLLVFLGWGYGWGVWLRNQLFDRGWRRSTRVGVPVISMGNLAVGGTGKTPLSAWLVSQLADGPNRPALLMRGYGVDEVELHRLWNPDVPVVVDPDRSAGALRAISQGAQVLVMDDGFQHRALARDLDIVLIAAEHPLPLHTLPRGPYRESVAALGRADVVVITQRTASLEVVSSWRKRLQETAPAVLMAVAALRPAGWGTIRGESAQAPTGEVMAVAGVGQPEAFRSMLAAELHQDVELMAFGDHHDYDGADVERIRRGAGPRTIVMTEKDAVKLQALQGLPDDVRVLRLKVEWLEGLGPLLERIEELGVEPQT